MRGQERVKAAPLIVIALSSTAAVIIARKRVVTFAVTAGIAAIKRTIEDA